MLTGGGIREYGRAVALACFVSVGGPHNFTWMGPGSNTPRGSISNPMASTFSSLSFVAREDDSGVYTCEIDDGSSETETVTIGNSLYSDGGISYL